ncbi:MAG TPA: hemerythrin domain-containing protein [Blastocatellia bacterium]|nr:hemerythrin domain-containing protein [Blastocatellia bacterium]
MTDPLHILKHEHRVIEQVLRALDGLCLKLSWNDPVPPSAMSAVLDFIRSYTDTFHHGKEERYLFPTLQEFGIPGEAGAISALLKEHQMESVLVEDLSKAAANYGDGKADAVPAFIEAARRYRDLLTGHMREEDTILFSIADGLLDESARERLSQGFAAAEGEMGSTQRDKYERMALELENKWSV